jgi:hypothetical protein
MSASIARFLKDFGEPEAPAMPSTPSFDSPLVGFDDFPGADIPETPSEPVVDLEAMRAASVEEGRQAERAELTAQFEAEKSAIAEQHVSEVAALKQTLEGEVADKYAHMLQQSMEQIVTLFNDQVLAALTPVITEELSKKAAEELALLVKQSLLDGESSKLLIKGPKAMFEAFNAVLALQDHQYQFTESSDHDLSVELGESIVVTRMSAWASSLRKVMK